MEGLFCFIPIAGWFDPKTYYSPIFQNKKTKCLILFTLIVIILPFYFALNAYTDFKVEQIEFVPYFNPFRKIIPYSAISNLKISSENRTSNSAKGQNRYYTILILELTLKDNSDYLILESEAPDDLLAMKTAKLVLLLKGKNIPSEIPYLLIGYSSWKENLDHYLQNGQ